MLDYFQSLFVVHARIDDLEARERICRGVEKDKLYAMYTLVDSLLDERRALTPTEIDYHKLGKYLPQIPPELASALITLKQSKI